MEPNASRRKVVGKFNLIAEIGHGGMADVYLAVSHGAAGVAKLAVLKEPRPEMAADPDLMAMFLDEARLAARLNHPNIVQTYEVGQDGARYFIAMEYLEGQPLNRIRAKLKGAGGMPIHMQARVLSEALAGLHYAHELRDYDGRPLNVVHRDVTPQNIFITYNGHTKVVDFGIAKAESSAVSTRTGVLKGKMNYMSPEQARGDKVDRRTDIFAAGVLLWEAVAGRRMWKGLGDVVLLGKITHGEFVPIREVVPEVDPGLERIIERAMELDPDRRYPTAADMQADLEQFLAESGERTSAAALATFMASSFSEERQKIQAVIEEQLRNVEPRATAEELPRIDPARILGTQSLTDADGQSAPSLRTAGSLTSATVLASGVVRPAPPKRTVIFAGAMIVGALSAGGAFLAFGRKDPSVPPPSPAIAAVTSSGEAAAGAVELVVEVSPADARVLLDDALLSTGKYTGKLPRENKVYKLRVEAPGHTSRVELVAPTANIRLAIVLEKAPDTAPTGAPSAEPEADGPRRQSVYNNKPLPTATAESPPPPTAAASAKPTADDGLKKVNAPKPARTLDTDNPYAK